MSDLVDTIQDIRNKYERWKGRGLSEADTCSAFVEPLLQTLGWDVHNPESVQRQFSITGGGFADYALKLDGRAIVFIEAKALDDPLEDDKSIVQAINYATSAGVRWSILTNGVRYRIFEAHREAPPKDKEVKSIDLLAGTPAEAERAILPLSRTEVERESLDILAAHGLIVRTLQGLISSADRKLVNILRKAIPNPPDKKVIEQILKGIRVGPEIEPAPPPPPPIPRIPDTVLDQIEGGFREPMRTLYRKLEENLLSEERVSLQLKARKNYVGVSRAGSFFLVAQIRCRKNDLVVLVKGKPERYSHILERLRTIPVPKWLGGFGVCFSITAESQIPLAAEAIRISATQPSTDSQATRPQGETPKGLEHAGEETRLLYNTLEEQVKRLGPNIQAVALTEHIRFNCNDMKEPFCTVVPRQRFLRIILPLKLEDIDNTALSPRDISKVWHYGVGDVELKVRNREDVHAVMPYIRAALEHFAR